MTRSKISYCDATWETVAGCTKCSPGCANCWAVSTCRRLAGMAKRMTREDRDPGWLKHYNAVLTEKTPRTWNGRVELMPENLWLPLHWRKSRIVFVCSRTDLFGKGVPFEFINAMFGIMAHCRYHRFVVLTKRPGRMLEWAYQVAATVGALPSEVHRTIFNLSVLACQDAADAMGGNDTQQVLSVCRRWPLSNVWLGATVEDQTRLEERIGPLQELADMGWRTWLSAEPLLWPLNCRGLISFLGGIVVGGEAGPRARAMHSDWPRRIRDDCTAAGVPFYFKQHGDWKHKPGGEYEISPHPQYAWGDGTTSIRVGKKAAGRLLDGVEHNALPWGKETV